MIQRSVSYFQKKIAIVMVNNMKPTQDFFLTSNCTMFIINFIAHINSPKCRFMKPSLISIFVIYDFLVTIGTNSNIL